MKNNNDLINLEWIQEQYEKHCYKLLQKIEDRLPYFKSSKLINLSSDKKQILREMIMSFYMSHFHYWMDMYYQFQDDELEEETINHFINQTSEVALDAFGFGLERLLELNPTETRTLLMIIARLEQDMPEHIEEWAIETIIEDDKEQLKTKYKS